MFNSSYDLRLVETLLCTEYSVVRPSFNRILQSIEAHFLYSALARLLGTHG